MISLYLICVFSMFFFIYIENLLAMTKKPVNFTTHTHTHTHMKTSQPIGEGVQDNRKLTKANERDNLIDYDDPLNQNSSLNY